MKRTLLFLCALITMACGQARTASPAAQGASGLVALATPFESKTYNLRIDLPPGVPLCGPRSSFSSLTLYYIPVEPGVRCEQFNGTIDWEREPDFVVIAPYLDIPLVVDTLDDYVARETFFCAGKGNPGNGGPVSSQAPTDIESEGQSLMGLETVSCTREDKATGRYSKALLAYEPKPNDTGHGTMVGAYVHTRNKAAADQLLARVAGLLKRQK